MEESPPGNPLWSLCCIALKVLLPLCMYMKSQLSHYAVQRWKCCTFEVWKPVGWTDLTKCISQSTMSANLLLTWPTQLFHLVIIENLWVDFKHSKAYKYFKTWSDLWVGVGWKIIKIKNRKNCICYKTYLLSQTAAHATNTNTNYWQIVWFLCVSWRGVYSYFIT